jgi:hypothetical protein
MQTIKLLFPEDTSREKVEEIIAAKTNAEYEIFHFYHNIHIGHNVRCQVIVDVPRQTVDNFSNDDNMVLDRMLSLSPLSSSCNDSGCGSGGCSPKG